VPLVGKVTIRIGNSCGVEASKRVHAKFIHKAYTTDRLNTSQDAFKGWDIRLATGRWSVLLLFLAQLLRVEGVLKRYWNADKFAFNKAMHGDGDEMLDDKLLDKTPCATTYPTLRSTKSFRLTLLGNNFCLACQLSAFEATMLQSSASLEDFVDHNVGFADGAQDHGAFEKHILLVLRRDASEFARSVGVCILVGRGVLVP
jgi:hypothetical protein